MKFRKLLLIVMLLSIILPVYADAEKEETEPTVEEKEPVKEDEVCLDSVMLGGKKIDGFDPKKYSYEFTEEELKEYGLKDNKIRIGYVFDKEKNTVTTNGSLDIELKPGDNEFRITVISKSDVEIKKEYVLKFKIPDDRSTDASLATLNVAGKDVTLSDTDTYTVEVDSKTKSAEVKATLRDNKASFIQGYGERIGNNAVTLSGETTNIEVRVKAENGSEKVYKIIIKKTDYKNNDATLKSLTIKEIPFNFKSNVITYNLEVKNEIDEINIEAITNDTKAKVNYSKKVSLNEGLNKVTIQVTAEDGSERNYRLNITRNEKVVLVQKISIEGIDFEFDPDTHEYEIETTSTLLNFTVTLGSKDATYDILNNKDLKDGSVISIVVKDKDEEEVTYKFKIKNEDEKEDIVPPKEEKEDEDKQEVKNEGFLKKNEMLIGLLTFGVGIISMLFAFLTKFKNK